MNKDLLQNMILEEADNEYAMLDEGFWDKVKARAAGAWAGTKQAAKNAKAIAKNAGNQLVHGKDKEDDVEDERGDSVESYNNAKFDSWKKSMTAKIRKFEAQMSKKAQALVEELYADAEDIGLEDVVSDVESKTHEVVNQVKSTCTRIGKIINPDYAKTRAAK
jgi:hypothetical protein